MSAVRAFTDPAFPSWIREIDLTLPVTNQILLTGAVRDLHLIPGSGTERFVTTRELLLRCFIENEYDLVYRFDPIDGIVLDYRASAVQSNDFFPEAHLQKSTAATPGRLADLIRRAVVDDGPRVAVIVDGATRLWVDEASAGAELRSLLLVSEKIAGEPPTGVARANRVGSLGICIVWVAARESDAPAWLSSADNTRIISVPLPSLGVRRAAASELAPSLPGFSSLRPEIAATVTDTLAESTQGLSLRSLRSVVSLAVDGDIHAEWIEEAVRNYLAGVLDSPWQDPLLLDRLARAETTIGRRVLGQERAVRRSLDILLRSAIGLTGAQSGGRVGRPQGILFFAGPTGVGKTELAKSLAEVLFGAEDAYTRFDMSEFAAEHSEARLIGAPPGYIGHGAGGELTNAVRQKPFSILLFDEIEKAHPRILDKFLQILEDGRLTDGSGNTVYFSETVIVFTSNLGAATALLDARSVEAGEHVSLQTSEAEIRASIDHHFTHELGRPELLNRIGDNIIVFDAISEPVGRRLVHKYVDAVAAVVQAKHGLGLQLSPEAMLTLETFALTKLPFGGRGIGSAVETALINPLTRALIDRGQGTSLNVSSLALEAGEWHLTLQVGSVPVHVERSRSDATVAGRPGEPGL